MAIELAGLVRADLAMLRNDAQALAEVAVAPAVQSGPPSRDRVSFIDSMQDALGMVNLADRDAAQLMSEVDSGQSDDLIGAMLASQQASLSFSMLMQVRNKVMGAMDELIKLPL
ncbi:MAG: flagellar hook-basal body complex protein FliE [Pseudomonadota bacterium]